MARRHEARHLEPLKPVLQTSLRESSKFYAVRGLGDRVDCPSGKSGKKNRQENASSTEF